MRTLREDNYGLKLDKQKMEKRIEGLKVRLKTKTDLQRKEAAQHKARINKCQEVIKMCPRPARVSLTSLV